MGGDQRFWYHDEGAVEVEALAAALGQHEPAAAVAVVENGAEEQRHVEEGVRAQEQQLPAVVLPVGPGQVPVGPRLLLLHVRGLQPVGSAVEQNQLLTEPAPQNPQTEPGSPDGQVLHHLGEVLQLGLQLLEGDGPAVVLVGGLEQNQGQGVQFLLRQRDGALLQTRLQNRLQLVWVDGTAACQNQNQSPQNQSLQNLQNQSSQNQSPQNQNLQNQNQSPQNQSLQKQNLKVLKTQVSKPGSELGRFI